MSNELIVKSSNKITEVTFNRPDKLNALTLDLWAELRDVLREADQNADARVIILSGNGRAFSAGTDIEDINFETHKDARVFAKHILECALTVEKIDVPVIAKVDGLAVGGGMELAAIADVTIATNESTFRLPETRINDAPMIAIIRFPQLIGLKRARELMLTGREVSAEEALQIGIVNEIVDPTRIEDHVLERAKQILKGAPMANRVTKQVVNNRLGDEALAMNADSFLFSMEDAEEGRDAFFENRSPDWEDR